MLATACKMYLIYCKCFRRGVRTCLLWSFLNRMKKEQAKPQTVSSSRKRKKRMSMTTALSVSRNGFLDGCMALRAAPSPHRALTPLLTYAMH